MAICKKHSFGEPPFFWSVYNSKEPFLKLDTVATHLTKAGMLMVGRVHQFSVKLSDHAALWDTFRHCLKGHVAKI